MPKSSLVITHRQLRVYPFGTPKSVEIFHSGDLKAFPQEVYHKLERSKKERVITSKPDSSEPEDEDGDEDLGDVDDLLQRARSVTREASVARAEPDDPTANSDGEGAAPGGTIRVTVRGSQTMTLGLVVKPTTTVVQLLRHYCRHFEIDLAELPGMWAEFEGERLDSASLLPPVPHFSVHFVDPLGPCPQMRRPWPRATISRTGRLTSAGRSDVCEGVGSASLGDLCFVVADAHTFIWEIMQSLSPFRAGTNPGQLARSRWLRSGAK